MISSRFKNDYMPNWNMNRVQLDYKKILELKFNNKEYELEKVNKCICGSANFEVLSEKDRFGLNFCACICRECGLITTSPRIKEEYLDQFYGNEYQGLTFGFKINNNKAYQTDMNLMKHRLNFLKGYLNSNIKTIIEIGCGTGHNLIAIREFLAENGVECSIYGCDYSIECISTAKNIFNLDIYQGNSQVLLDRGLKADLIILSHVFEHFTEPTKEIEMIKRLLNKNGIIYIEVPGIKSLLESGMYEYDLIKYLTLAHMYNFSLYTLENVMRLSGFKLIKGDEFVHSIFALDLCNYNINLKNDYKNIYDYLIDLEEHYCLYQNLTKMFIDKKYNDIIENYTKYNYLEVFYYLYKSYLEIGDKKKALEYLLKYIEKVRNAKKELTVEELKKEARDIYMNSALNDLVELIVNLEYNVQDFQLDAIYELSKQYEIVRKKTFEKLYSQFILNEYDKILKSAKIDIPETSFYLAKTYKILGQNSRAINYFIKYINFISNKDKSVDVYSKDFEISAYYHLGELYYNEHNEAEAQKCFEKSIKLSDGKHIKAEEYLKKLASRNIKIFKERKNYE